MSLKKLHKLLNPKMGNYGKFVLPLSYPSFNTKDVVINTRKPNYSTFFDVSHMGIFESKINNYSIQNLNNLLNINVNKLIPNKSKLCVILNKHGCVIDDLILSNINNEKYRLIVNANNKDFFRKKKFLDEKNKHIFALQGNGTQKILEKIYNINLNDIYFMENININNDIELSRCGYTGEDGFEIYLDENSGYNLFNEIINASKIDNNVLFGGLIARDILRLEAGLNLSGAEFNENMNTKFNSLNMNFLLEKKFRIENRNNLISDYKQFKFSSNKPINLGEIYSKNEIIGLITSSTMSFNLKKFIALGYIKYNEAQDNEIYVKDNRNKENILKIHVENFINTNYYKKK
jgi:aminomethyltransferase